MNLQTGKNIQIMQGAEGSRYVYDDNQLTAIGVRLSAGTQLIDGLTAISAKDGLAVYEINSAATYRLRLNGAGSQTYQVTLLGDVNRDGRVDVIDSEAYQNKDLLADVDGNGAIDRSDAELIASNYGFVAQPGFGTGAGNIATKNVAISEIVTPVTGVPVAPVIPPSAVVGSWLFDLAGALPVGVGSLSDPGWQTQGDVVLNGQRAILGEGNLRVARLGKAFTIPVGAQTLKFTLQTNWGKAVAGVPREAVQVSLRGSDGLSLLGNALDGSSGFLNVQADGKVYFTNGVKGLGDLVTGDNLAGDSHTFLVDVRSIAQNLPVIFSLNFLGNGTGDGQVIVSDVGIVVMEAPVAVADRYNSFQGVLLWHSWKLRLMATTRFICKRWINWVIVAGRVGDGLSRLVSASYQLGDGRTANLLPNAQGEFALNLDVRSIPEGDTVLKLMAVDGAGNKTV